MKNEFKIDFFELAFLTEACITPKPIARTMFFQKVSDEYYHQLSKEQREKLFDWITKCSNFDLDDEDCKHFHARFNPENQFLVSTEYDGKKEDKEAYKYRGGYHLKKATFIAEEYIYKVEPIKL